jgi:hypothetical protein
MENVNFIFKKELMGLLLTLGALALTVLAMISYIHDPKLDPAAMSTLIAPVGAGGLLFYGIRTTEGYFNAALNTNKAAQTTQNTNDQPLQNTK